MTRWFTMAAMAVMGMIAVPGVAMAEPVCCTLKTACCEARAACCPGDKSTAQTGHDHQAAPNCCQADGKQTAEQRATGARTAAADCCDPAAECCAPQAACCQ